MPARTNYNEVNRALGVLGRTFAMQRRPKGSKRIGEEILELIAATIYERTAIQKVAPDGHPLAALLESSLKRKLRKHFPPVLGIETGAMLDKGEIQGDTEIEKDSASMEYGLGEWERQKAEWFQEGGDEGNKRPTQAERPFYDLGDDGMERLMDYIDEVAEQAREEFEGG